VASPRTEASAAWADIPADRVVRLRGATPEQLAVALDPSPSTAPAVIRYHHTFVPSNAAALAEDILDRLDEVARGLFPDWLVSAERLGGSDMDRRVVRELAYRLAANTTHFTFWNPHPGGPDVAPAALRGRDRRPRSLRPAEVRR
jgi:hypothetical protein